MYYVRGLSSSLKFSLGYFATYCAISYQLTPIIWKAVSNLELTFDCINIRSLKDGKIQINIFCNSYEDVNNFRFNWLENSFLKLFEEWKQILSFVQKILPEMLSTACLFPIRHVKVCRLQYFPLLKIQNNCYNMAVLMY